MSLKDLPSVERMLNAPGMLELQEEFGRPASVEAIRTILDLTRKEFPEGKTIPTVPELVERVHEKLKLWTQLSLVPVINATGVIIHTNLGRAPLSKTAIQAMQDVAHGYSTLEYDLPRGKRGKRETHVEELLTRVTGAEAALVLNNNAAVLLLLLSGLSKRKEVIISRTQLIEIGGGFRIPEIMKQSGAKLMEVGTTNRTHLKDYESAITERSRLILRAHHSNFRIIGFTTEPSLVELVELGRKHGLPVVDDLGSGALIETTQFGLGHEPTVQESLRAGSALVAFSGDKLLGGPQAGVLVGEKTLIAKLRRHPLARALRADKLCLAALGATLLHYVKDEVIEKIPVWQMISVEEEVLKDRATTWQQNIGSGEVIPGRSTVGGGSLPEETLPTWLLALAPNKPNRLVDRLRQFEVPIIARIEADHVLFDPRTVLPEQEQGFVAQLRSLIQHGGLD